MLKISSCSYYNFRNFESLHIEPSPEMNIIVGDNAVGKTNIIEGIQLLTVIESFRKPKWNEVIRWGETSSTISLVAHDELRSVDITGLFSEGKRSYQLNGKIKKPSQLKGILPSVLFCPDDLLMVKGPARVRRDVVDSVGVQISPGYNKIKHDYEKVVTQRNKLLKETPFNPDVFKSWTESLINIGSLFYDHRKNLFAMLRGEFVDICSSLLPHVGGDIRYYPSWGSNDEQTDVATRDIFAESLRKVEEREYLSKMTMVGPQRDDLCFYIGDREARKYASQGQQRVLTLAFKLAEVRVITKLHDQKPLLLLDDVMSELDTERRSLLLEYVLREDIQTFITSAHIDYFSKELISRSKLIRL